LRIAAVAVVIILAAFGRPPLAGAQPIGKSARVGILDGGSSYPERLALWSVFKRALGEMGHVEGKNVTFEFRWGEGHVGALPQLADELVRAKVDVIVTAGTPAGLAAKRATPTIPIVLVLAGDPVRTGLAASLSRPGSNITGLTTLTTELSAKRLEFLRQIVPTLTKLGVVWDNNPAFTLAVQDTEAAARRLNMSIHAVIVSSRDELDTAFADFARLPVNALEIMPTPVGLRERQRIADLALKYRLPTAFAQREYVEAGGLMSYGSNFGQLFLRAATYVDKVLKGARPADLPIEQPTTFELVINLRTARALGVTIPPSLQARADHIVE
jgi:putative tryptophan/tyrosine transport system substrate-binding protein